VLHHFEEAAMKHFPNQEFEVHWLPFELNERASKTGVNKVQMYVRCDKSVPQFACVLTCLFVRLYIRYMEKFHMTKERCMEMSRGMAQNFARCGPPGLPYKFTEEGVTGNTFNSHRLINFAGSKGAATQDAVVEELFKNYFAEEKFLNDPEVLAAAAIAGGIAEDEARKFVADETVCKEETEKELSHTRSVMSQQRANGVPFFQIVSENGSEKFVSGAQV
jgi:predicted DsbA family dithiol-disulfide isomerase